MRNTILKGSMQRKRELLILVLNKIMGFVFGMDAKNKEDNEHTDYEDFNELARLASDDDYVTSASTSTNES